jgi:site-specific DNA-methyltransferase (adenine-specific)
MSLTIAKERILTSIHVAQQTEIEFYERLHDLARDFVDLKKEIANAGFIIKPWVRENLPRTYEWLQSHVRLFVEWDKFLECLKWADEAQYPRNEHPSLMVAYDLMDEYDRNAVRLRSCRHHLSPPEEQKNAIPDLAIQPGEPLDLTPTTTVILGDGVDMTRQHVAEGTIDVATIDAPYFLGVPPDADVTDFYLERNGEKPRFREEWDRFDSVEEYEEFSSAWIDEVMRCLDDRGSMFIHGVHTNLYLIGRLLQIKGIQINNNIAWVKRNSRPNICQTRLRYSNEAVIWAVKNPKTYRFNYRRCKLHHDPMDCFSERGKQMRDVWDIPARKGNGHPSPKPVELYTRMLDVVGRPGGKLLELFCGAGPGAIAAMRWGMESASIDREPKYLAMLAQRVRDEQQRSLTELALAADGL